MHSLDFSKSHSYPGTGDPGTGDGISVPVALRSGSKIVEIAASIDTGSSFCFFEGIFAGDLGLELTDGVRTRCRTVSGSFEAFGHEVEIEVMGIVTHSLAYFFADPMIVKNVLGRGGWLDRIRLAIVDYDRTLYLSPYDQDAR